MPREIRAYRATLARVTEWTRTRRSLFLRLPAGTRMPHLPGQFVSCLVPVPGAAPLSRAYSLASSPEDALLELALDLVPGGPGSRHLFGLAPGDTVNVRGPFGSFVLDEPPAGELVFVGDGSGIAPIRPMVRRALERGGTQPIRVLQGAASELDLLYGDELAAWAAAHARLAWEAVLHAPASEGAGPSRLEALVVERFVVDNADRERHFWICGVGEQVRRMREALRGAGYERRTIHCEQW